MRLYITRRATILLFDVTFTAKELPKEFIHVPLPNARMKYDFVERLTFFDVIAHRFWQRETRHRDRDLSNRGIWTFVTRELFSTSEGSAHGYIDIIAALFLSSIFICSWLRLLDDLYDTANLFNNRTISLHATILCKFRHLIDFR